MFRERPLRARHSEAYGQAEPEGQANERRLSEETVANETSPLCLHYPIATFV